MTLPFALPDWLPWWVPTLLLVPVGLYALAFLFMPFSVIGLKSRLETIEARLDEIQGEIRHMTLRMPEQPRMPEYDDSYTLPGAPPAETRRPPVVSPPVSRPPIPPAAQTYTPRPLRVDTPRPVPAPPAAPAASPTRRSEPRLDWPR